MFMVMRLKKISFILLIIFAIFSLNSCINNNEIPNSTNQINNNYDLETLKVVLETLKINETDKIIEENFSLPREVTAYGYKASLKWSSSDESVLKIIDYNCQIYRTSEAKSVILTALATFNSANLKKEFKIIIKEKEEPEYINILNLLANKIELPLNNNIAYNDFILPDFVRYNHYRATISWQSTSDAIKIDNYNVKILKYDTLVTLTATIFYDNQYMTKDFVIYLENNKSFIVNDVYAYDYNLDIKVYEDEIYNTSLEVALYIVAYNELPSNYVTKDEFNKLDYNKENMLSCGGDRFMNYEQLLPLDYYYECDILYNGGNRNAKRLVYSLNTLSVYYTIDHYESFNYIYINGSSKGSIYII